MRSVRIYRSSFRQQVLSYPLVGYPYVVATSEVALINGTVSVAPVLECHPRILER